MTQPATPPRSRASQAGMTLIELMLAMLLTGIICGFMLSAFVVTNRTDKQTSQDSISLAALRLVTTRIDNELREARRVYQDSTATKLHFWVDSDRDNQQDLSERITFELVTDTGATPTTTGTAARMVRYTDASPSTKLMLSDDMQSFSGRVTFGYSPTFTMVASPSSAWTDVTLVAITLVADEAPGPYPGPRTLKTDLRLRNARTY